MESREDSDRTVQEAIAWIQQITVERANLELKPADLDPDLRFYDLEVVRYGGPSSLDSIDLVNVIAEVEDTFDEELLEEIRKESGGENAEQREITIRGMATFLFSRLGADRIHQALETRSGQTVNQPPFTDGAGDPGS